MSTRYHHYGLRMLCSVALLALLCSTCAADQYQLLAVPLPPFTMQTDQEKIVCGISAEILITILNRAGITADQQDLQMVPWARGEQITRKGPKTMLISAARIEQREKFFKWVGPVANITLGAIAPKSKAIRINKKSDFKTLRIGVDRNSAPHKLFLKIIGEHQATLELMASSRQILQMMKVNRLDMILYADLPIAYLMTEEGMDPAQYEMVYPLKHLGLYIALSPDTSDALVQRMQSELNAMKQKRPDGGSEFQDIQARYLSRGAIDILKQP